MSKRELEDEAQTAAHDLICIGEIMQALGGNNEVDAALVGWLGKQIGEAAGTVNEALRRAAGRA